MAISLYTKSVATPTKKPTKAQLAAVDHALALARVRRPDIEAAIASGQIHKLPRLAPAVVKNPALRRRDHSGSGDCYRATESDLGRATTNEQTQSMALKTWLVTYYVKTGVFGPDEIAIVVD